MLQITSQCFSWGRFKLIVATVFLLFIAYVSPAPAQGSTKHVRAGQCIQAAINEARCGDRILVGTGTYAEQLTIETDGIALIGSGAVLIPPTVPSQNTCSGLAGNGTQAGICVTGSEVVLAPFLAEHRKVQSVSRSVKDILITGFQIRGFSGENVAVVGAWNVRVTKNTLIDGEQYGFLTAGSSNTQADDNTVASTGKLRSIGMCMDDVTNVQVSNNDISGYFVGLCVQTSGADVCKNNVKDSCVGVFVDPGINGANIRQNHISSLNPTCEKDSPASGIIVDGAVNTGVQKNVIEGQTNGGSATGIAIVDDQTTVSVAIASGNVIEQNILRNNDIDIYVNTTGIGNVITNNVCSTPEQFCALK